MQVHPSLLYINGPIFFREQCLDKILLYVNEAFTSYGVPIIQLKDLTQVADTDFHFKSDGTFLTFEYSKEKSCPICQNSSKNKCTVVYYGVSGGLCVTVAALMLSSDIDIKYVHKIAEEVSNLPNFFSSSDHQERETFIS